jgi:hypothetical protein
MFLKIHSMLRLFGKRFGSWHVLHCGGEVLLLPMPSDLSAVVVGGGGGGGGGWATPWGIG